MNAKLNRKMDEVTTKAEKKAKVFKRKARKSVSKYAVVFGVMIGIVVALFCLNGLNTFYAKYELYFRSPLQNPLVFHERILPMPTKMLTPTMVPSPSVVPTKAPKKRSLVPVAYAAENQPTSQEIADYIKSKSWSYEIALRVAKSENAWNRTKSFDCSRTHTNNDGSIDRGIFQINSVHDKKISPEDALDCFKNIDYAHGMWSVQGWGPWYAYKNGSYLTHDLSMN